MSKESGICKNIVGKEHLINAKTDVYTQCTRCDFVFCPGGCISCFSEHKRIFKCKGTPATLLKPQVPLGINQPWGFKLRKTMKHKYISWETPPKKGEKFVLFTKKNRMIMVDCITDLEANKGEILKGEEILGWKSVDINKNPPPFLQSQIPKRIDA